MQAPKIYRYSISVIESILGLSATPLGIEGLNVYLLCQPQLPNSREKKIAVHFVDDDGEGFDVYDYTKELEYTNIIGQFPQSIGPALIKNIETIYPDVERMVHFTDFFHGSNQIQFEQA